MQSTMILRQSRSSRPTVVTLLALLVLAGVAHASIGDRLPDFKDCVEVCKTENCLSGGISIPIHRRLLFWTCPAECDYACQQIITDKRVASGERIVQFHGKWPFYRFLGMQEPFSVLFSFLNYWAHYEGRKKLLNAIPASYSLRKYYIWFSYFNMTAWVFSMIFHTRDFNVTEELDYFGAGATVLYGMFYTPIRIFRWDQGGKRTQSLLRAWTLLCILLYIAHVTYLKWWDWDYTYNMAANVVIGVIQNILWTGFSIQRYRQSKRSWAAWPGFAVAWIILAMSLELFDFPPLFGCVDAHSLWHLGTVAPTILWYNFLVKDAQDDLAGQRLKA